MSAQVSDVQHAGVRVEHVGVFGSRSIVDETHHRSARYPKSLVPDSGIRVSGLSVDLTLEMPNDPEAAVTARSLFDSIFDRVEDVIRDFQADQRRAMNDHPSHDDSPSGDTRGSESRDVPDSTRGATS